MAELRANSVHDWASHFLQALANDAEGGELDKALDEACLPGSFAPHYNKWRISQGFFERCSALNAIK